MVRDSYFISHCFIREVRITLIRKAKTPPLVNISLLLTLESTGSEWKEDLNNQVGSDTSGNPIKEKSYKIPSNKIGKLKNKGK
jgi:hypothetical protein